MCYTTHFTPWLQTQHNSTRITEQGQQIGFSLMAHTEQRGGGNPKSNSTVPLFLLLLHGLLPLGFYCRVNKLVSQGSFVTAWKSLGKRCTLCARLNLMLGKPQSRFTCSPSLHFLSHCSCVLYLYQIHSHTHTYNPPVPTPIPSISFHSPAQTFLLLWVIAKTPATQFSVCRFIK